MSFAYFPFYTGDYYRDTRHLSMLQHGAYRQLLDHCWDQRGPLPLDLEKCYRICGAVSKEEQECVRAVIAEFFVAMDDGHYQKRVMKEIERAASISSARSGAAQTRWKARETIKDIDVAAHDANAVQKQSNCNANGPSPSPSPSPSLTPTPTSTTKIAARKHATASRVSVDAMVAEGVPAQHAADWLAVRAAKHLPLTPTAWEATKREAQKAGITPAQAVRTAAANGWGGFKATWLQPPAAQPQMRKADALLAGNIDVLKKFAAERREKDRTWDLDAEDGNP